jgi:hypothetical protein
MGVSNLGELEETMRVWESVLDGLPIPGREVEKGKKEWSLERRKEAEEKARGVWDILGEWKDFAWASPEEGYVNTRVIKGVIEEDLSKTSRL